MFRVWSTHNSFIAAPFDSLQDLRCDVLRKKNEKKKSIRTDLLFLNISCRVNKRLLRVTEPIYRYTYQRRVQTSVADVADGYRFSTTHISTLPFPPPKK